MCVQQRSIEEVLSYPHVPNKKIKINTTKIERIQSQTFPLPSIFSKRFGYFFENLFIDKSYHQIKSSKIKKILLKKKTVIYLRINPELKA